MYKLLFSQNTVRTHQSQAHLHIIILQSVVVYYLDHYICCCKSMNILGYYLRHSLCSAAPTCICLSMVTITQLTYFKISISHQHCNRWSLSYGYHIEIKI